MCSMKHSSPASILQPDRWPEQGCSPTAVSHHHKYTNLRLQPQGSSEWMGPKQNCNSSRESPWAFHAGNKNWAPPASETLFWWENGSWFPMAAAPIAFLLIRGGDRSYAEHVKIWHCSWKWHCFSPAMRWIPSAVWEQKENSKVNITSQGRSCSSCVFWRKKCTQTSVFAHLCAQVPCSETFRRVDWLQAGGLCLHKSCKIRSWKQNQPKTSSALQNYWSSRYKPSLFVYQGKGKSNAQFKSF